MLDQWYLVGHFHRGSPPCFGFLCIELGIVLGILEHGRDLPEVVRDFKKRIHDIRIEALALCPRE